MSNLIPNGDNRTMEKLKDTIIKRVMFLKGNMTQKELGEIIGCKQGKVSELLNSTEDKMFSVVELLKLAKHFHVSVDYLLGHEPTEEKHDSGTTPRQFCKMLVDMKDKYDYSIGLRKVSANEIRAYYNEQEMDIVQERIESNYLALYFSDYDGDGKYNCGDDEQENSIYDLHPNFNKKDNSINTFLGHWQKIRSAYLSGSIDKEYYDILVDKKLSEVIDE